MRKITLYRDDTTTQVVLKNIKHYFFTADNSILSIAKYTEPGVSENHSYIHWPISRICWFKDEPMPVTSSSKSPPE